MHSGRLVLGLCLICTWFGSQPVFAAKGDVRVSGFARAGGALLLDEGPSYLNRIDRDGDAGDTQFGINVYADLGSGYQVAGQIWGAGTEGERVAEIGPTVERFHMVIDWAFITKRFNNSWSVSAGKIKYPNLLVSEFVDVGLTYPWVRPPEELYRFETEGPYISLESFEGASVLYSSPVGDADITLQTYGGQAMVEDGHLERMLGLKATWATETLTLIAGHNRHLMDTYGAERGGFNGETASVTNVGATLDAMNILAYAEYAIGKVHEDEITAYYGTVGYRLGKFLPHFTYAHVENTESWGQSSMAVGVKYQFIPAASLKIELKNIRPLEASEEGGEETAESAGFFAGELDNDSANIFSIALDVVF